MKRTVPQKRWFFLALPIAMLLCYLIWLFRFAVFWHHSSLLEFIRTAGLCAAAGILSFPSGIVRLISLPWSYAWPVIVLGYGIYGMVIVVGAKERSLCAFIFLCLLLALNIVGCQLTMIE